MAVPIPTEQIAERLPEVPPPVGKHTAEFVVPASAGITLRVHARVQPTASPA